MMRTLRTKLIVVFIVATLAPLLVTVRISVLLLQRSLNYSSTVELDDISKSLEATGRQLYQHAREDLQAGRGSRAAYRVRCCLSASTPPGRLPPVNCGTARPARALCWRATAAAGSTI